MELLEAAERCDCSLRVEDVRSSFLVGEERPVEPELSDGSNSPSTIVQFIEPSVSVVKGRRVGESPRPSCVVIRRTVSSLVGLAGDTGWLPSGFGGGSEKGFLTAVRLKMASNSLCLLSGLVS